jgi:beta-xylosidase
VVLPAIGVINKTNKTYNKKSMISQKRYFVALLIGVLWFNSINTVLSQKVKNPLTTEIFTADANPFIGEDGTLWVIMGRDEDKAVKFTMKEYHLFSTTDMVNFKHHGAIVTKSDLSWMTTYPWAASAIYKDGKYYLYIPDGGTGRMGVLVADEPTGPWTDPVGDVICADCMDPHVFIDDDGQAYLSASIPHQQRKAEPGSLRTPFITKLKNNMIELEDDRHILEPTEYKNHCEASWIHKYKGKYYYSYKGHDDDAQRILYCTSDKPMGPYKYQGVIMEPTLGGNLANHQGIIKYKRKWWMFYHSRPVSNDRFRRNVSLAPLTYGKNGVINLIEEPDYNTAKLKQGRAKFGVDQDKHNHKKKKKGKKAAPKKSGK